MRDTLWQYKIQGFYSDNVKSPKIPGQFAIEVLTADSFARDMEITAFKSRDDIGKIIVVDLNDYQFKTFMK